MDTDTPTPTPLPSRSLISKLAEVMAAVERIPKRGHNEHFNYDFATEADIAAAIRKELASRHVLLVPGIQREERIEIGATSRGTAKILTQLDMTFTFYDGESGEELTRPWRGCGLDSEDKGLYKAITGGAKYFLLKTFLIATGDDPEREDTARAAEREARTVRAPAKDKPPSAKAEIRPTPSAGSVYAGAEPAKPSGSATQATHPIPESARATIPDGCALIVEARLEPWGTAKGWAKLVDSSGVEGKFAIFKDPVMSLALEACDAGTLIRPGFKTPVKGGKTYLDAIAREATPESLLEPQGAPVVDPGIL